MDKERVEELFKLKLCRTLNNMEKEHSAKARAPKKDIHIVAGSA
jgi:hypothetical protein